MPPKFWLRSEDKAQFVDDWDSGTSRELMALQWNVSLNTIDRTVLRLRLRPRQVRQTSPTILSSSEGEWVMGNDRIQRWQRF